MADIAEWYAARISQPKSSPSTDEQGFDDYVTEIPTGFFP